MDKRNIARRLNIVFKLIMKDQPRPYRRAWLHEYEYNQALGYDKIRLHLSITDFYSTTEQRQIIVEKIKEVDPPLLASLHTIDIWKSGQGHVPDFALIVFDRDIDCPHLPFIENEYEILAYR